MYSVYFNDVLQNENDVINIYDSISFSIDREDKLNSSERIFRDKCNSDFSFCGCAYDYLYNLFVNDKCEDVILTVYNDAGLLLYKGTIQPTISEFNLGLRVCKTKVRDMSFSSKLHDNMDLEVILSNRNTISCKPIEVNKTILGEVVLGGDEEIISFDILDVIKYIVSYISDNSINVVSDYLSLNGFVITTGYNLYGIADGVMASIYPNVSLKKVFDNLYKFLNLYFSIDSYMDGEQYLRIEPYEYFFNDEVIYSIDELPLNTTHFVDIDRIFSNIKVGNNNNIEKEVFVNGITINPKRYRGFMEFTSTTCRSCGANISNTLDLSGDFIVDHNVITNILSLPSPIQLKYEGPHIAFITADIDNIYTDIKKFNSILPIQINEINGIKVMRMENNGNTINKRTWFIFLKKSIKSCFKLFFDFSAIIGITT